MDLPSHLQKPKLCSLRKWETFSGYGFNLHSEKGKQGQFIGKVDPNSPSDHGGLNSNDVLIEVNGINVEDASHNIVVGRVKSIPDRVDLFVCNPETYKYCRENDIKLSSAMHNIEEHSTPLLQPSEPPAAVQQSLQAAVEQAGGAHYEEVGQENLPERFRNNQQQQEDSVQQRQSSGEASPAPSDKRADSPSPPPSFSASMAAKAAAPAAASAAAPTPAAAPAAPRGSPVVTRAAAPAAGGRDPLAGASLAEVRARVGQNKRNQVKMNSGTFSEKYNMFEAL